MYLLMIFALAGSAISLGILLFQYINLFVPDVASTQCQYGGCDSAIRSALAFLIVLFPVLVWSMRFLRRDVRRLPAKRELPIRRWLLYLTLFVAGLIVIGDLVGLVRGYLQGELTVRFILKVLAIFFIAGSVFYYYLKELHVSDSARARLVGWVATGIIVAAVVAGVTISGSPTRQRDVSLDQRRVNDLQVVQEQVVNGFWAVKGRLPTALSELEDDITGFRVPRDPETGDPYPYERVSDLSFRLCATFTVASDDSKPTGPRPFLLEDSWRHGTGETCFNRTIDPERIRRDGVPVPKPVL